MTEKRLFEIVILENGLRTIKETKNNYVLPINETKSNYVLPINQLSALCILLNYVAVNGDVPDDIDTLNWWNKTKYDKYKGDCE